MKKRTLVLLAALANMNMAMAGNVQCDTGQSSFDFSNKLCAKVGFEKDRSACVQYLRSELSPAAAARFLSGCVEKVSCLNLYAKFVIDNQVVSHYGNLIKTITASGFLSQKQKDNLLGMVLLLRETGDDFGKAEKILKPLVEAGSREAMGTLAQLYMSQKRYGESLEYLNLLRKDKRNFYENPLHVMQYAQHLQFGFGVEKDLPQAKNLYKQVVNVHHTGAAEHLLGWAYLDEGEVGEGLAWLKKSVGKGYSKSAENLGSFYLSGKYVAVDLHESLRYFKEAARLGSVSAIYNESIIFHKMKEYKKSRIAMMSAAYFGHKEANKILRSDGLSLDSFRCDVEILLNSSDNFLFN